MMDELKGLKTPVLGVALEQPGGEANLKKFLQDRQISWPQYADGKHWKTKVALLYGVQRLPLTILVDARGRVRAVGLEGKKLQQMIERLLKESR
jgi:hypothetical protein